MDDTTALKPQIDPSWYAILKAEFDSDYFGALKTFLVQEKHQYEIYPKGGDMFNAFNLSPFDQVKVVILGQDPYHGPIQAHGLCFSVPEGIAPPPSLVNIFKEYQNDLKLPIPKNGNLTSWAQQGVFLLNATLSVRAHQAGSHQNKGWETFTDAVIRNLSDQKENLVFVLWGNFAQKKSSLIDSNRHLIIKAVHPSPLSANRGGFFGTKPFSKINAYLIEHQISPINWKL